MRIALIGLALTTLALPAAIEPAEAQRSPRPWCLNTGFDGPSAGVPDCSYHTLEQCMASIGGGGDSCSRNPALEWDRREGRRTEPPRRR
jgi:hypothetical protein